MYVVRLSCISVFFVFRYTRRPTVIPDIMLRYLFSNNEIHEIILHSWHFSCLQRFVTIASVRCLSSPHVFLARSLWNRSYHYKTRRMAIANGCVSFCNQPKAVGTRHILASSGYAPGIIAVNVTWMERGFNAGQTHSSIYSSIFNSLRAIARYWSDIATFSYPTCI